MKERNIMFKNKVIPVMDFTLVDTPPQSSPLGAEEQFQK